ncbi:ribose-phosphate pyrophosphokinase [Pelotomaculum terephthalicicum JT]|uniref:ribose-phosphate diphosphokinase n=1 Tax=Pelotomaculum TaxID=191373 RepID=UPI0009C795CE|nr:MULTISPECIES: ribose-phosphate pyrophosphokinase [Pelotomaculum]MCG9969017.1 ribose-phosphate pyrophosphokinase [Pelotomaculum terephthalicicum JT]OPX91379.1 MAG: Ribose-phosphate pyrophosphokinase [Pelotomaculum sp. PtaB.Bin117]OPY59374.1 MAG: Ribose-phosphate pyrophosphokinase [Pelotomaculum sp. PtaU1.Bin065]
MTSRYKNLKIFTGNANTELAEEICQYLGVTIGASEVTHFSDGEVQVRIDESVRGADVFVIQPTSTPVNENLMELLIMIDAVRRASARRITAVMPYYGYARQDRKTRARDPITSKLVANILTASGARRVLTMDLHAGQIQGFFDIPVDHLPGVPILAEYFMQAKLDNVVVVSPDLGGVTRARDLAERIGAPIAIIDKRRPEPNMVEITNIIGAIHGKTVIMVDDIIDTAGTITLGAAALKKWGVNDIYVCCTHGVLSGPALDRLAESPIKEVVITNTIPVPKEKLIDKIKILSVAPLLGEAIIRIHEDLSVSKLFDK